MPRLMDVTNNSSQTSLGHRRRASLGKKINKAKKTTDAADVPLSKGERIQRLLAISRAEFYASHPEMQQASLFESDSEEENASDLWNWRRSRGQAEEDKDEILSINEDLATREFDMPHEVEKKAPRHSDTFSTEASGFELNDDGVPVARLSKGPSERISLGISSNDSMFIDTTESIVDDSTQERTAKTEAPISTKAEVSNSLAAIEEIREEVANPSTGVGHLEACVHTKDDETFVSFSLNDEGKSGAQEEKVSDLQIPQLDIETPLALSVTESAPTLETKVHAKAEEASFGLNDEGKAGEQDEEEIDLQIPVVDNDVSLALTVTEQLEVAQEDPSGYESSTEGPSCEVSERAHSGVAESASKHARIPGTPIREDLDRKESSSQMESPSYDYQNRRRSSSGKIEQISSMPSSQEESKGHISDPLVNDDNESVDIDAIPEYEPSGVEQDVEEELSSAHFDLDKSMMSSSPGVPSSRKKKKGIISNLTCEKRTPIKNFIREKLFVESDGEEDQEQGIEEDFERETNYSEFDPNKTTATMTSLAESLDSDSMESESSVSTPARTSRRKKRSSLGSVSSTKRRKKPGRDTIFIVEKAQRVHAIDDSPVTQDGLRRSKRQRTKPLKFWKNERFIYHTTDIGMGAVMPVPCDEVRRDDSDDDFGHRSKKPRKKSTNPLKDYVSNLSRSVEGELEFKDKKGRKKVETVGCSEGMLKFASLASDNEEVKAAKFLDTDSFSSGLLIIPPKGVKEKEKVYTPEVFYVRACPEEGIAVCYGSEKKEYGTGDNFWIPPHVEYSIENLSSSREVQLFFFVSYTEHQSSNQRKRSRRVSKN